MTILGILTIAIVDLFMYRVVRSIKISHPNCGMFLQKSTVSFVLGVFFGLLMYRSRPDEVKESLRLSFEFLFMNLFLPFILMESALNEIHKVTNFNSRNDSSITYE